MREGRCFEDLCGWGHRRVTNGMGWGVAFPNGEESGEAFCRKCAMGVSGRAGSRI